MVAPRPLNVGSSDQRLDRYVLLVNLLSGGRDWCTDTQKRQTTYHLVSLPSSRQSDANCS